MARLTRLELVGQVHLISLRGNNGQAVFHTAQDHTDWLQLMHSALALYPLAIHGFCLMPNSIYLLVTPHETGCLSACVQHISRRFVRLINTRHGRTGTLFEGRFRSGVLQANSYLLDCMTHLDNLPVRAGLALQAADYAWSSCAYFCGLAQPTPEPAALIKHCITPHPALWTLGNTPYERENAYKNQVLQQAQKTPPAWIENLYHGWVLGDADFLQQLQAQTPRRISQGRRGRPRKQN